MNSINIDGHYTISEDIVAREIEGELIIVPLVRGIGDLEDELFTLNKTARAIWNKLDGKNSLRMVIDELASEFDTPKQEIEDDVLGLVAELVKRRMLIEVE